jgi:Nucleotidyltransferase of unknown function (DUF6036)
VRHRPQELERFVEAIDAALPEPASILVIGGAAAALAYGATRPTDDIDTFNPLTPVVRKAVEAAQHSTGLTIPVSFAAVADAPYDFEDRLVPIRALRLKRLTVVVPERHDLVLMKTLRGYQHDVEVIEQIHQRQPLVFEVLRSRWKREMSHAVVDPRRANLNFVEVVDHIFGRERAEAVRRELGRSRGPDR